METKKPADDFFARKGKILAAVVASLVVFSAWWVFQQRPHALQDGLRTAFYLSLAGLIAFFVWGKLEQRLNILSPFASLPERLPTALLLSLAILPSLLGAGVVAGYATNDEAAYLLQSKMFSEGRISEPLTPHPDAFVRRQVMENRESGLRYSKYPPGTALALTPAAWLGFPWLATAFAGVLDLLLLGAIAKRLKITGAVKALLVCSPVFMVVQSSFQSEVFTLPMALLGYLALLRLREGATEATVAEARASIRKWGLILGAAVGFMFLCRPLTAVVFAVSIAIGLRQQLKAFPWVALSGSIFAFLFLAYNQALTGDAFQTTYAAYAEAFQPLDQFGTGNPAVTLQTVIAKWFLTFGAVAGALVLGFWGAARQRVVDGGAGIAFLVLLPLTYSFHWYPGHWAYLGPLYLFETSGILLLGLAAMIQKMPAAYRSSALFAMLVCGLLMGGRHFDVLANQSRERFAPIDAASQQTLIGEFEPQSVVFITDMKKHTPTRPQFDEAGRMIFPENGPVFLRPTASSTQEQTQILTELGLNDRPVYLFAGTLQRMR